MARRTLNPTPLVYVSELELELLNAICVGAMYGGSAQRTKSKKRLCLLPRDIVGTGSLFGLFIQLAVDQAGYRS